MPGFVVRRLQPGDLTEALLLNNANVPAVNALDAAEARPVAQVRHRRSCRGGPGRPRRLLPGLCNGRGLRQSQLPLVLRAVHGLRLPRPHRCGHRARRLGVGNALYDGVFDTLAAHPSISTLCCEVNVRPLNDGSLRFHHRLGFREVGQQETDGGAKTVSLMTCN